MPRTAASCRSWPPATMSQVSAADPGRPWPRPASARARSTASPIPPGPGLVGALLVGGAVARSLAFAWDRPAVGVHHLEGHLLAPMLEADRARRSRSWRCWCRAGTPCWPRSAAWATTRSSARPSTMRPARPSTRLPSCSACRIRAGRRWRSSPSRGAPGRFKFPAPDARPARPRFQFQRPEDRGGRRHARRGARRADARRRRLRVSAGGRRYAGREVRARARRKRDCERWSSPAAWAPIGVCAQQLAALGERIGCAGALSATGVLYGQRGDDRVRWLSPPRRGRTRRSRDPRDGALAARHPASAARTTTSNATDRTVAQWTRSFSARSRSNASSASGSGSGASSRPSSSIWRWRPTSAAPPPATASRTPSTTRESRSACSRSSAIAVSAGRDAGRAHRAGRRRRVRRELGQGAAQQAGRDPRRARRRHRDRAAHGRLRRRAAAASMADVYVAAGSNVEPERNLCSALQALEGRFGPLRVSPAYRNKAVGFTGDGFHQSRRGFRHRRCRSRRCGRVCRRSKPLCGRPPDAPKWAPRTMDLDILLYGDARQRRARAGRCRGRISCVGPTCSSRWPTSRRTWASRPAQDDARALGRIRRSRSRCSTWSPSHAATAIDRQDLAGDVRRLRREEQRGAHHVLRRAAALEQRLDDDFLLQLIRRCLPRATGSDPARCRSRAPRARARAPARASASRARPWRWNRPDAAASGRCAWMSIMFTIRPCAGAVRRRRLRQKQRRAQVGADAVVPLRQRDLAERRGIERRGVVDQHVQPAERGTALDERRAGQRHRADRRRARWRIARAMRIQTHRAAVPLRARSGENECRRRRLRHENRGRSRRRCAGPRR